jgi:hypothetical protein
LGLKNAAVVAVAGASLISVLMHSGNLTFLVFVLLAMAVKGSCYLLTRRIGIAVGYHAAWNFSMITILGMEAQGGTTGTTAFYIVRFTDATWASAATGSEMTLPVLLALLGLELVALLLILGWTRVRYGSVKLREDLATPNFIRGKL